MKRFFERIALFILFMALPAAAEGRELLFVFQDGPAARIYDAESLRLLATPQVGLRARHAFGVADAAQPGRFEKLYVVSANGITILNPDLSVRRTLFLSGRVSASPDAAALSPDAAWLLVAASDGLVIIETARDSMTTLPGELTPSGVVVSGDSQRAYVRVQDSPLIRIVDLPSRAVLDSGVVMPVAPTTLATDSGGSAIYAGAPGALFRLPSPRSERLRYLPDAQNLITTDSLASLPRVAGLQAAKQDDGAELSRMPPGRWNNDKLLLSDNGRFYLISRGRLIEGELKPRGMSRVLFGPPLLDESQPPVTDVALSRDTQNAYVAHRDGLNVLSPDAKTGVPSSKTLGLSIGPSALALVSPSPAQADLLEPLAGDGQIVEEGTAFTVTAGGQFAGGVVLSVSTSSSVVTCESPVTTANGPGGTAQAVIDCQAAGVASVVAVTISVTSAVGNTSFNIVVVPSDLEEGLTKLSNDPLQVESGQEFQLVVQAVAGGLPDDGLDLTVDPSSNRVDCPAEVTTGVDGRAAIVCEADIVNVNTNVTIEISSASDDVTFTVTIAPAGDFAEGLSKASGDNQFVPSNSPFPLPLVVRAVKDGELQKDLQLNVEIGAGFSVVFCSSVAMTGEDGLAKIECVAGAVTSNNIVNINVRDGENRTLASPFRVTVIPGTASAAAELELRSASSLQGTVGETLEDAIEVRARDDEGVPVSNAAVFFEGPEGVSFSPSVGVTNASGDVAADVTFGCPARSGVIRVGRQVGGADLLVNYVSTGGPPAIMNKLQGDNQSGSPGERLSNQALVVEITDECGTPRPGIAVDWDINPTDAATLENVFATTDGRGRSSVVVRLGNRGGEFTVTASSEALNAVFRLTVNNVADRLVRVSGDGQTVALGETTAQPLVVEVQGGNGFGVPGVAVTFAVIAGSASLTTESAVSGANGRTSTLVEAGGVLGPIVVEARAADFTVRFTITTIGGVPAVTTVGFVNAGSFRRGLVPGSLASIFGSNLMEGIDGIVNAERLPLPTTLRGVRVLVEGIPAPIVAIANVNGQEQINIQVPFGLTVPGTVTVVIENNGSSAIIPGVTLLRAQPGIFEGMIQGSKYAAALHANYRPVTPSDPAVPGEIILLFLTGVGAINPAVATNVGGPTPPAKALLDPVVGLDHAGMQNFGAFYAPGFVGLFQINFRVGANVSAGNRVLNVVIDGVSSQETRLPVGR